MQDSTGIFKVLDLSASLSYRARRAVEAKLRDKGLTYAQYGALAALAERDGLSQAELAIALETDSTTAMVLRGSLEKKGLVERVSDPSDGRVRRISLTGQGTSLLKEASPVVEELFSKAGEIFSEPELKRLIPLLERLREFAGEAMPVSASVGEPKRRGRPRKERPAVDESAEPKRRGRPRKAATAGAGEEPPKAAAKKAGKKAAASAEPMAPTQKDAKAGRGKKAPADKAKPAAKASAKTAAQPAGKKAPRKPKAS